MYSKKKGITGKWASVDELEALGYKNTLYDINRRETADFSYLCEMETKKTDKKGQWGGARPGGGRKAKGSEIRRTVSINMEPRIVDAADAMARRLGISRGDFFARLVVAALGDKKEG